MPRPSIAPYHPFPPTAMIDLPQGGRRFEMSGNPVSIFISYSRKDEAYMQELVSHLDPLQRGGLISSWYDGQILPGEEWAPQIKQNLEDAQIILLLISKDFLNSDYCYEVELTKAIERHQAGTVAVIPVILRSCLWDQVSIGSFRLNHLQALPRDAKPISQWHDPDDAFTEVAKGLLTRIQQLQRQVPPGQQPQPAESEHHRQDRISAQPEGQAAARHYPQAQDSTEQRQREADFRHQQQESPELKRPRTPFPYGKTIGKTTISRQQFLQWGGLGGAGLLVTLGISRVFRTTASPPQTTNPDADNNSSGWGTDNPDTDNNSSGWGTDNPDGDNTGVLVDYGRLAAMLQAGQWQQADQETLKVMLKVTNREEEGSLDAESLQNFPCDALGKIDRLWGEASDGKFGFSAQKKIYVEGCGGRQDGQYDETAFYCFADRIGWRVKGNWLSPAEVTFDSTAPAGHLPTSPLTRAELVSFLLLCRDL